MFKSNENVESCELVKFTPHEIGYGADTQYRNKPKTLTLQGDVNQLLMNCFVIDHNQILVVQSNDITVVDLIELEQYQSVNISSLFSQISPSPTINHISCCRKDMSDGYVLSLRLKHDDGEFAEVYAGGNYPGCMSLMVKCSNNEEGQLIM